MLASSSSRASIFVVVFVLPEGMRHHPTTEPWTIKIVRINSALYRRRDVSHDQRKIVHPPPCEIVLVMIPIIVVVLSWSVSLSCLSVEEMGEDVGIPPIPTKIDSKGTTIFVLPHVVEDGTKKKKNKKNEDALGKSSWVGKTKVPSSLLPSSSGGEGKSRVSALILALFE